MNPGDGPQFDDQVSVKMTSAMKARLRAIEAKHGITPPEFLRRLGLAAIEFFDVNDWFSFPVKIAPEEFQKKAAKNASGSSAEKAAELTLPHEKGRHPKRPRSVSARRVQQFLEDADRIDAEPDKGNPNDPLSKVMAERRREDRAQSGLRRAAIHRAKKKREQKQ